MGLFVGRNQLKNHHQHRQHYSFLPLFFAYLLVLFLTKPSKISLLLLLLLFPRILAERSFQFGIETALVIIFNPFSFVLMDPPLTPTFFPINGLKNSQDFSPTIVVLPK